ncbi:Imm63 family immunity protein [Lelliottia amnigena]|uniref:Imm63 family immunity protein n=1 Tax=Lelliottia amnigena TaxID=61646 RepID=UPI001EF7EE34|nr:Imm63 family immunity protein [Lelliottia amnigena]MCG7781906.1 immunity 63 family protein [Lelliottia amnigena]
MSLMNINELQEKVESLALLTGASPHSINLRTSPADDGAPYISFENNKYNYIFSERGYEFFRRVTDSSDEILYWIMLDFVHDIAVAYELKHRVQNKDGRRIYFPKIVELMSEMKSEWGCKAQQEIDETLRQSPYDDALYK